MSITSPATTPRMHIIGHLGRPAKGRYKTSRRPLALVLRLTAQGGEAERVCDNTTL